jgi:hypothetical protein
MHRQNSIAQGARTSLIFTKMIHEKACRVVTF